MKRNWNITDKKITEYFVRGCISSKTGSGRFLFESVLRFAKTPYFHKTLESISVR